MKTRYVVTPILSFLLSCIPLTETLAQAPEIRNAETSGAKGMLTLMVHDSKGAAVSEAKVSFGFFMSGVKDKPIEGYTDENGMFPAEGLSRFDASYTLSKKGYYQTIGTYQFLTRPDVGVVDGKWQPWNPTIRVLLNEIGNPVPMIARRLSVEIPAKGKPVGLDLEIGDWVAPYGRGFHSDFIIEYEANYLGPQAFKKKMLITFSGVRDGVAMLAINNGSILLSQHQAPEDNYVASFLCEEERTEEEILKATGLPEDMYLVFRIRTKVDERGTLRDARYGKIYPQLKYGLIDKKERVEFAYYFNPDGTRNIEFDPEKNIVRTDARSREWRP